MSRKILQTFCRLSRKSMDAVSQKSICTSSRLAAAKILDGVAIAKDMKDEVKAEIEGFVAEGRRPPNLCVIQVGEDPASKAYVTNKIKACKYTGITSEKIVLPVETTEEHLLSLIKEKSDSDEVDGLLVQLPVPKHITERKVCNAVHPSKDVDGFNIINIGKFCSDQKSFVPATPAGVMEILRRSGIETFGKNAVVCGRSKNVGMPLAMLLHADGVYETKAGDATTTICHRYTPPEQLKLFTKTADILVVAVGIPGLITADMVKEGVAVIDIGINRVKDEKTGKMKLVGDVDFEGVSKVAGHITPVPGGVGPITVAMLMKNTLTAYKKEITFE
ncbi:bifunctional methylenetetrahydrofolate dehydrogenase/cyclohydrolase, mitochondrial-like [Mizuhopecten yessoensis]|uniref:methenyltetrahydrofolate cyclohydrolase n=1 Tax=Mizuhopecten yessoensis TaxID=6573 RepID=A0A210R6G9_MIZYE|nr:bifunctional methylenetetrahydrofolate dehydrogenase/cyclohydrolase, mitochondrial-like [Mizuhopecten yessoensis]OWF56518.1 Bifunctional methylenetetrahydrofolate dehydrogenase/cyclohydrolase, mitochondrial [Mizuhopecten yessoensis]